MRFADTQGYEQNIRPGFLGDLLSREHVLPGGVKLDASTFLGADDVVVIMGAAAAKEATSLTVEALLGAIPSGTILNFGTRSAVTVTVGAAGADVDDTSIPCAALSGPIPSGTLLYFGSAKKFALTTAAAAAAATSITVQALPTALVENDEATYADETTVEARLTSAASIGDTSLAVAALDGEIADAAVAYYRPKNVTKRIPAGTPVYAAIADIEGGANGGTSAVLWSYAGNGQAVHATNDEVRLLAYDVYDVENNNDGDLLRPGTLIHVNHLPEWSTLDATVKTHIRNKYECSVGTPGQEVAPDA